ncbi:MAG: hypothetical protein ACK5LL_08605 [Suipraeoptans sp.]
MNDNKGRKIFIIACISIIAIGVVGIIAGVAMGATVSGLRTAIRDYGSVQLYDYDYDYDNNEAYNHHSSNDLSDIGEYDNVRSLNIDVKIGGLYIIESKEVSTIKVFEDTSRRAYI